MTAGVVLVVDDDADSRDMLIAALTGADFTPIAARDGAEALELLDRFVPDLVLMDAIMPIVDGFEACRRIKARGDSGQVPIIFMTGLSDTEHVVMGLRAGGVDYLTKPVAIDELLARVSVHLANARAAHGARVALDTAGRRLMATDVQGDIVWATPQAAALLAEWAALLPTPDIFALTASQMIAADAAMPAPGERATRRLVHGEREIELRALGRASGQDYLFNIVETTPGIEKALFQKVFGVTAREADTLFWIARGKSNRDISDILNISPRTVNAHLDQVFVKLGVENRAAAAAVAIRTQTAYN